MARPAETAAPVEPDEAAEATPSGKSKKKLFIIIGLLVVLLGGGGAAAWFFTRQDGTHKEAEVKPPIVPIYLALETFTVNLQGGEQYLQTEITLQVADQAQVDAIKLHMPRVRSRLLALLSSKHAEELITAEDKKKLAQEIVAQVKLPFDPKGKPQQVDDVLFTSFVIQ
ncbi:MAG TPA: flagellar basal body-associated protein FliL [Thiobacillus sp.]|nr:flagellar basal body-associated protein FliL [Thiobacillus sp.]